VIPHYAERLNVPEGSGRNALRGTLASRKNDESFESGFWELYLHEGYRRSGYTITIHPDIPGASTHPDFLIEGHGSRFYLEAVRAGISVNGPGWTEFLRSQAQAILALAFFTADLLNGTQGVRSGRHRAR
jgi:hypothetical protein